MIVDVQSNVTLLAIVGIIVCIACFIIWYILRNPFPAFPYYHMSFDVSGKRNVGIDDYIDKFLNKNENWKKILKHEKSIRLWEKRCEKYIRTHHFKKRRQRQYEATKDLEHAYAFKCTRNRTKYRQRNYQRTSYIETVTCVSESYSFCWLQKREKRLASIGHTLTLREYATSNQRKLMTKSLRKEIMWRDSYTCQLCGKYMPDEVGLQIDHIIPVSRGGKSIPSNLRVLCSKCNGKKGNKYDKEMRYRRTP